MYDSKTYGASDGMNAPYTDFTSNGCRYRAIKEHLLSELNDEAVILSLKNGKYYGLNSVGFTVWTNVLEAATLSEIESWTVKMSVNLSSNCPVHNCLPSLMRKSCAITLTLSPEI